jgi:uncharacterized protein (TIGR00290 family)
VSGTARERVLLSWSGGKDSSLALEALRADPEVEVVGLLTSITRGYDRISIHGVRRALLETQARALGLPLHEVILEPACSNDDYEAAFAAALDEAGARFGPVERIAFGDLFLEDVRSYRERLVSRLGWSPLFPIWGIDTPALAKRFVARGYAARIVCVDTTQLGASFSGRLFDEALLADLPEGVDPCGERGEFHTFVTDGPIFSAGVAYQLGSVVIRDERFAYCDLLPV